MTGSIAVSQCGHTPNRPGHHGTVVAKTVGSVAISCNVTYPFLVGCRLDQGKVAVLVGGHLLTRSSHIHL